MNDLTVKVRELIGELSEVEYPTKVHATLFSEDGVPFKFRHKLSQVGFISIERGGMVYTIEEFGRSQIVITSEQSGQNWSAVELLIQRAGPNRVVLGWRKRSPRWRWKAWVWLTTTWRTR